MVLSIFYDVWLAAALTAFGIIGLEWECSQIGYTNLQECGLHSRWF